MIDKAEAPQLDAGPHGAVLNVNRDLCGRDPPLQAFTPRSLAEHEHDTIQVSVLLNDTLASIGWHGASGTGAGRRLRGGQAYVVPPFQPHDFRLIRPEGMVNFHLSRTTLTELDPTAFEDDALPPELSVLDDTLIAGLGSAVHREALREEGLSPLYLDAAWVLLATQLARSLRPTERQAPRLSAGLPPAQLRRVLEYVDAHLCRSDLRVADMAGVAGLSPVHFTRLFVRSTAETPLQYVIGRRLALAREMLTRGHDSIGVIAFRTGYGSQARFSEAFRRRYGVTPGALRRQGL